MDNTIYTVEFVTQNTQKEMIDFLKRHEDYSMFMLGNFEAHGCALTDAPNSGNFKLIRQSGNLVTVFCLTRRGNLLVQSEVGELVHSHILESCQIEDLCLKGVIGEWNFCHRFWEYLKSRGVIQQETFVSKEVLYSITLSDKFYDREDRVRVLKLEDYSQWQQLTQDYRKEMGLPDELSEEQNKKHFDWMVEKKIIWGLFSGDKLATMAVLNAKALDLGQVGGVYTAPAYRKQGQAKALMRQLMMDVKNFHGIRKLIIFTDEHNLPARNVYESFGVKPIGEFSLLFGT